MHIINRLICCLYFAGGEGEVGDLNKLIADELNVDEEDIYGSDLIFI